MNHTLSRQINTLLGRILSDMLDEKTETLAFPWTKEQALQAYHFATLNNERINRYGGCKKKIIGKVPENYLVEIFEYIGL
jgi:hypothetical protein